MNIQNKYWTLKIIKDYLVFKEYKSRNRNIRVCDVICHCWKEFNWKYCDIKGGRIASCWCSHKKRSIFYRHWTLTHWMTWTHFYNKWNNIIKRCYDETNNSYKNYWGRWIKCEWNSFEEFYADMWDTYKQWLTIDREDNNWNYSKDNCKWSTDKEQANNKRSNKMIKYNNKVQSLTMWCEELNLQYRTTLSRLTRLWWTVEKALTK